MAAGSMLAESMVTSLTLIAATSLFPLNYFKTNVSPRKLAQIQPQLQVLGFTQTTLAQLSA